MWELPGSSLPEEKVEDIAGIGPGWRYTLLEYTHAKMEKDGVENRKKGGMERIDSND
jgi:hypothetical protein